MIRSTPGSSVRQLRARNKFGVAPKCERTYRGRVYASKLEARTAVWLDVLKLAGQVRAWEPQPARVELRVNGRLVCRYLPDFLVEFCDGRCELWESKGVMTDGARFKLALYSALQLRPDVRVIREVDVPSGM